MAVIETAKQTYRRSMFKFALLKCGIFGMLIGAPILGIYTLNEIADEPVDVTMLPGDEARVPIDFLKMNDDGLRYSGPTKDGKHLAFYTSYADEKTIKVPAVVGKSFHVTGYNIHVKSIDADTERVTIRIADDD